MPGHQSRWSLLVAAGLLTALLHLSPPLSADVAPPPGEAERLRGLSERIARAYGLDGWAQVAELRYTFNVSRPGGNPVHRTWIWRPPSGAVTLATVAADGTPQSHTWTRGPLPLDDDAKKRDHAFINDQYWLLFPLHLSWDTGIELSTPAVRQGDLPAAPQAQDLLRVHFSSGGYTPGDTYDLVVGPGYLIQRWSFTPAGESTPKLVTTWEDHRRLGPLVIAMSHKDPETGFHLWFSDVNLLTVGGERFTPTLLIGDATPSSMQ